MISAGPLKEDVPPALGRRVDGICNRFEDAWAAGQRPKIEDYLKDFSSAELPFLLRELVKLDAYYRRAAGETPGLDEYRRRFPELPTEMELDGAPLPPTGPESPLPTIPGYLIHEELGRGGMGIVYRAYDCRRNAPVAVKTLLATDAEALYRFKQEFRALADIAHPNLVTLYELTAEGRTWFFSMELVEGVDFLTYVRAGTDRCGRLRAALRQLAEGVNALHAAGRLHRDIKPSNVLVTGAHRLVLLDFGLATELDRAGLHQSTERHILGTVAYMAPEQAAGEAVSPASDWYSVGVMLYQALTGRLPFEGAALQVLRDKQEHDPPPPHAVAAGIPEDLSALCQRLLRRDPAARPLGVEVLRRLGDAAQEVPAAARPISGTPFVGRGRELAALTEAYEAVRQGRTVTVAVHGRSGAGKTALVQHFLEKVAAEGEAVVLAGRCYDHESVPYKALDSVVDALSRFLRHLPALVAQALLPRDFLQLARVFPVLRRVDAVAFVPRREGEVPDPQEMRRRAFTALRELLARLGDRWPVVLFIDDLQWGDADSAALLAELLRPPDPPALLLLVCYRSEEVERSACLRALLQAGQETQVFTDRRVLVVDALAHSEARELALELLGRRDTRAKAWAEAIARESGGCPFLVYELALSIQAGAYITNPAAAEGEIVLDEVLWARIHRLPELARRLLELVAVSGRPVGQEEACRAVGLEPNQWAAVGLLSSGRLIRNTGLALRKEIETYHDRIRETVLAHLPSPARRKYHFQLANTLEATGQADPEVLAIHFQGAGQVEQAGRYFAQAATRAAETLAFDQAAKLYGMAVKLAVDRGEESLRLRVALADALANSGHGPEAAREYLAATRSAGFEESLGLQRQAALQFLISGYVDEGLAVLRTVLEAVGMRLPGTSRQAFWFLVFRRAQLAIRGLGFRLRDPNHAPARELSRIDVCWSATCGLSLIDTIRGAYFQTRQLLLALQTGEPFRLARALALEDAHVASLGAHTEQRVDRILRTAEDVAQQLRHPYVRALTRLIRGATIGLIGRWKLCQEFCDEAEAIFRNQCTGVSWEIDTCQRFSLWSLTYRGELAEVVGRLPQILREARERGNRYAETNVSTFVMPLVQLAADQPDRARHDLHQSTGQWSHQGIHVQHLTRLLDEGQIDLYEGDGPAAWNRLNLQWRSIVRSGLLRVQQLRIFMLHLRARTALQVVASTANARPFLKVAQGDAGRLLREQVAWAGALATLIQSGLAARRGEKSSAKAYLARAARLLDGLDMRLHAAAARRRLGQLVGGEEGQTLMAQVDTWMASQHILKPARMTAMLAPGFPD